MFESPLNITKASSLVKLHKAKSDLWGGRLFVFPMWPSQTQDIICCSQIHTPHSHTARTPLLGLPSERTEAEPKTPSCHAIPCASRTLLSRAKGQQTAGQAKKTNATVYTDNIPPTTCLKAVVALSSCVQRAMATRLLLQ